MLAHVLRVPMQKPVLALPGTFISTASANDSNAKAVRQNTHAISTENSADMVAQKKENIVVSVHVTRLYAKESVLLL